MNIKKIDLDKGQIRAKIWIEDADGQKVCGRGPIELLEKIDALGSIQQATEAMGMSYKKALALLHMLNKHCSSPVINTNKGGSSRGGATLTPAGLQLIKSYQALEAEFQEAVQQLAKAYLS
ncbi:LysR family transcriptional regulator [Sphingobacterium oryzagri]|uniref:LysR family transcriptional regulator n=1 Tax=Sphingobacterium oryzagri TaxID=3025669 RepID=A0ABY7WBK6_9SPHI|nr:LysR family transcriptional regulator [Sphingobacterium sp. KACC 22765]WDF66830.1 LysR family transcriptional regulator [Sphingobacterium sp. KACC 22765]